MSIPPDSPPPPLTPREGADRHKAIEANLGALDPTPEIPVGLATTLGISAGALAAIAAPLLTLADGDQTAEAIAAVAFAAVNLVAVILGRMAQAAAAPGAP